MNYHYQIEVVAYIDEGFTQWALVEYDQGQPVRIVESAPDRRIIVALYSKYYLA